MEYTCNICIHIYIIFLNQSSVDGHLSCFHVLPIVNSAAMNIGVSVFFFSQVRIFSRYMPRSEIARSRRFLMGRNTGRQSWGWYHRVKFSSCRPNPRIFCKCLLLIFCLGWVAFFRNQRKGVVLHITYLPSHSEEGRMEREVARGEVGKNWTFKGSRQWPESWGHWEEYVPLKNSWKCSECWVFHSVEVQANFCLNLSRQNHTRKPENFQPPGAGIKLYRVSIDHT